MYTVKEMLYIIIGVLSSNALFVLNIHDSVSPLNYWPVSVQPRLVSR